MGIHLRELKSAREYQNVHGSFLPANGVHPQEVLSPVVLFQVVSKFSSTFLLFSFSAFQSCSVLCVRGR